jgi:hypothetical protein
MGDTFETIQDAREVITRLFSIAADTRAKWNDLKKNFHPSEDSKTISIIEKLSDDLGLIVKMGENVSVSKEQQEILAKVKCVGAPLDSISGVSSETIVGAIIVAHQVHKKLSSKKRTLLLLSDRLFLLDNLFQSSEGRPYHEAGWIKQNLIENNDCLRVKRVWMLCSCVVSLVKIKGEKKNSRTIDSEIHNALEIVDAHQRYDCRIINGDVTEFMLNLEKCKSRSLTGNKQNYSDIKLNNGSCNMHCDCIPVSTTTELSLIPDQFDHIVTLGECLDAPEPHGEYVSFTGIQKLNGEYEAKVYANLLVDCNIFSQV